MNNNYDLTAAFKGALVTPLNIENSNPSKYVFLQKGSGFDKLAEILLELSPSSLEREHPTDGGALQFINEDALSMVIDTSVLLEKASKDDTSPENKALILRVLEELKQTHMKLSQNLLKLGAPQA